MSKIHLLAGAAAPCLLLAMPANLGNRRAFDPYSYLGYPVVAPNQPRSAYVTLKVRI